MFIHRQGKTINPREQSFRTLET